MRRYNLVQPYWLSFFSKDLYADVVRNWPGFGFLYLLLLLALAWVPEMVKLQRDFSAYANGQAQQVIAQMPRITILRGEVTLDPPGPHYIKDPETGKVMMILDTAADLRALNQFPDAALLLTRTQIITRPPDRGQMRTQDLAGIQSFSIDQNGMRRFFRFLQSWLGIFLYPVALLGSYAYRVVQALLYGALALGIAGAVKARLEYAQAVRLAVMAVTPVILVGTALELLSATPPYWWLLCFIIAMWYLFFGVKAAAEAPPASADSPVNPVGPA